MGNNKSKPLNRVHNKNANRSRADRYTVVRSQSSEVQNQNRPTSRSQGLNKLQDRQHGHDSAASDTSDLSYKEHLSWHVPGRRQVSGQRVDKVRPDVGRYSRHVGGQGNTIG